MSPDVACGRESDDLHSRRIKAIPLVLAGMRADRMVAVIDGDEASIAAERLRLAARAGAVSVELIGRNA
jgi:hypothetical protein